MITVTLIDIPNDVEIGIWAKEHCPSFTGWVEVGVSPERLWNNYIYYFEEEKDVVLFQLRWQGTNNE